MRSDELLYIILDELDVKLVGLIIGGGQFTIQQAYESVIHDSPIVIINNSGPAANVLVYAFQSVYKPGADTNLILDTSGGDAKKSGPKKYIWMVSHRIDIRLWLEKILIKISSIEEL